MRNIYKSHINSIKHGAKTSAQGSGEATHYVSLPALSSLAMMKADLVEDMADEYHQAQYNLLGVLNVDKDLGRLWRGCKSVCVCERESVCMCVFGI